MAAVYVAPTAYTYAMLLQPFNYGIAMGGRNWLPDTPWETWSFRAGTPPGGELDLRFETRYPDQWGVSGSYGDKNSGPGPGGSQYPNCHNEFKMADHFAANATFDITRTIKVEAGAPTTGPWCIIGGQWFGLPGIGSPFFSIDLKPGDKLRPNINYRIANTNFNGQSYFTGLWRKPSQSGGATAGIVDETTGDLVVTRGVNHTLRVQGAASNAPGPYFAGGPWYTSASTAWVKVWWDGVLVLDYTGPMGWPTMTTVDYKFGIYRTMYTNGLYGGPIVAEDIAVQSSIPTVTITMPVTTPAGRLAIKKHLRLVTTRLKFG